MYISSNTSHSSPTSGAALSRERAGFWRRSAALLVDFLVIGLIFQVIAVFAYDLSGGRLQSSGLVGMISHSDCQMLSAVPAGIEVPATFQANFAAECIVSVFGHPIGKFIVIGRQAASATIGTQVKVTTDVSVAFPIDAQGNVMRWPLLDLFIFPALILWRLLLDRWKGSLGRRMFAVRLVSADPTATKPAAMSALAKRYCAFAAVFAPIWLVLLYQGFNPGFGLVQGMRPVLIGAAALTCLLVLGAAIPIIRRNDAFYDWLAGTRVVRLNLVEAGHAWSESTRQVSLSIGGGRGISGQWVAEERAGPRPPAGDQEDKSIPAESPAL